MREGGGKGKEIVGEVWLLSPHFFGGVQAICGYLCSVPSSLYYTVDFPSPTHNYSLSPVYMSIPPPSSDDMEDQDEILCF